MIRILLPLLLGSFSQAATVGDLVWLDANRNGLQDKDEKPQADIGLKLYFDKNKDGFPERLLDRATSDKDGRYSFAGL